MGENTVAKRIKWILFGVVLFLPLFSVLIKKPHRTWEEGALPVSAVKKSTEVVATPTASPPPALTPADRRQDRLAAQILASKNDNDPRLDRDLKVLGDGAKFLLRQRYSALAAEGLNERGTLVFLLGRNITSAADMAFLDGVIQSQRCLGLADCAHADQAQSAEQEAHHSGANSVTLAYPQIVALKAIESYLAAGGSLSAEARATLDRALGAPDPMVARLAESLVARLGR